MESTVSTYYSVLSPDYSIDSGKEEKMILKKKRGKQQREVGTMEITTRKN